MRLQPDEARPEAWQTTRLLALPPATAKGKRGQTLAFPHTLAIPLQGTPGERPATPPATAKRAAGRRPAARSGRSPAPEPSPASTPAAQAPAAPPPAPRLRIDGGLVDLGADGAGVREVLLARPPRLVRGTLWTALLLLLAATVWSCLARVEVVVVAPGVVRPRGELRRVEATAAGAVTEVLVEEGAAVASGQVLARIDRGPLLLERDRLQALVAAQRQALEDARTGLARLADAHAAARATREGELRQAQLTVGLETARADQAEREGRARLATAEAALAAATRRAELQAEKAETSRERVRQGLLARDVWVQDRRTHQELEAEVALRRAEVEAARVMATPDRAAQETARSQVELRRRDLESQRAAQALEVADARARVSRAEADLASREQEQRAVELRLGRAEVRAPLDGRVQRLAVAPGRVVGEGELVAELVPADAELVLEALVAQTDRGELAAGLPVRVRLAAFPHQDWGGVDGRVERIGADAEPSTPGQSGPPGFRTSISLVTRELRSRSGQAGRVEPGMTAQADVVVGERPVIALVISQARELLDVRGGR